MENIKHILAYTVKQHLRTKIYLIVILFGLVLVLGALVVSSIALEERVRMFINIGLAGIEFLALITVIFATVNMILEEMESKTIYLILAHPIKRVHYLLGRYLGTLVAVGSGMFIMACLHVAGLFLLGWSWEFAYVISLILSFGKIMVMSAIALFLALFSTSAPASMAFTIFVWIIGHFSEELKFMGEKTGSVVAKSVIWAFYYISPNLAYYNYRDFWVAGQLPGISWFAWIAAYSLTYITICLMVSSYLFSQKEF